MEFHTSYRSGYPIIMSGVSNTGGTHAWVVSGIKTCYDNECRYNESGNLSSSTVRIWTVGYYMNWGHRRDTQNEDMDGWYTLSGLPEEKNYINEQMMVVNIR